MSLLTRSAIPRRPPATVRRQLRVEVGFGCPLCGSPHLEYHHFDPPFAAKPHHNPKGMIALCATHHAQADGFTVEQIRELKSNPHSRVSSQFKWRRRHTVFVCGGNFSYKCNVMLHVHGFDLVYFEQDDDGYDTLSLNIYDICLNSVFVMRKNDWVSRADVDDIETPPSANKLRMHSKIRGVKVDIEFKDRPKLNELELGKCRQLGIPENENVVFCYFNGNIATPVPVSFQSNGIFINGMTLSGNTMSNCGTGIHIG